MTQKELDEMSFLESGLGNLYFAKTKKPSKNLMCSVRRRITDNECIAIAEHILKKMCDETGYVVFTDENNVPIFEMKLLRDIDDD